MPKSIVADVITTAADTPEIKAIAAKAAGAAFVNFIDNVFLRLSVCVAFFIFVQNLKVKKVTDAQSHFLRRMSTVVFYAHMIIFFLWGLIDGKEPSYGFTGFIASLVGTVVLAVIISANRIKNSRLVRELFG